MKPIALAGHADFRRAGRAIGLGLLFLLAASVGDSTRRIG